MIKIAIPAWGGIVSPVFDTASRFLVFQIEDGQEKSRFETHLIEQDLTGKCLRIRFLGVDLLICGAISRNFSELLKAAGIQIVPWISGSVEDVLNAYINGKISNSEFLMPGCKGNKGQCHKGRSNNHE